MTKKQKLSDRHIFADRIARIARERRINSTANVKLVEQEDGRKFYQINVGRATVNVYGTDFIQFQYDRGKGPEEAIFDSKINANKFYRKAILESKFDEANKIPRKQKKEKNE